MLLCKQFLKLLFKLNLRQPEKAEAFCLAAHLCLGNEEPSRQVAKQALIGLNKCVTSDVELYVKLIGDLLSIDDEFKHLRAEWLIGYPQYNVVFNSLNSQLTYKVGLCRLTYEDDPIFNLKSTVFKS
jgi:hypothetical protein